MNSKFFGIVFLFSQSVFISSCSQKRVDLRFIPDQCSDAKVVLEDFFKILETYDIRDSDTRNIISSFFESDEDRDLFIAKMTFEIRKKGAFYGNIVEYSILGSKFSPEQNRCDFEVAFVVRKKYPLGDVQIITDLSLFKRTEDGKWFIEKPEYIGDVEKRDERKFPDSIYY